MIKKILFLFALLAIYLGIAYLIQPKLREVLRASNINQDQKSETPASGGKTQNRSDTISYDCEKGKTAYDLLLKKTNNQVVVKDYPFGKLVEAIQDTKGGTEGKYWLYFIDGKSATVSADNYHCQNKEKVEWKFDSEH